MRLGLTAILPERVHRPMTESEKAIAELIESYHYKPVPPLFAAQYHSLYQKEIPSFFKEDGDSISLYDLEGNLICNGYERIVIGDYGAFIEFSEKQAARENFMIAPGQEYRVQEERFAMHIKYVWLTTKQGRRIKIYHQKKTVPYADYRVGMYYVSPFEVKA